jgi:hypothetical protein
MRGHARALAGAIVALLVVGCAAPSVNTFPPVGFTPGAAGDATAATKTQLSGALGAVGLQAVDAQKPYRPPEGALLTAAPRSVVQVQLPDDPDHGYVVIYAFDSAAAAEAAARDQATYMASGPGSIQFPPGSHEVLRIVGTTVVFFTWTPGSAPDQRTHLIEDALDMLGAPVASAGAG